MCLLIMISGVVPGIPLIVAANRDERRDRPAVAMTRLDKTPGGLAILGGRDEVGGGTWLATNAAGVVAGLTNRPLRDGPDAAKRSRGELPLALAVHPTAAAAVDAFGDEIDPGLYNPSWLFVADRHDAFFVDVTGTDRVVVEHLGPGVHVLENRTVHEPSAKVERVRQLLDPLLAREPRELVNGLPLLLADHDVPDGELAPDVEQPASGPGGACDLCPRRRGRLRHAVLQRHQLSRRRLSCRASGGPPTPRAVAGGGGRAPSGLPGRPLRPEGPEGRYGRPQRAAPCSRSTLILSASRPRTSASTSSVCSPNRGA